MCLALCLTACDSGSTTGGGTSNSLFVGTYEGSTTVAVSTARGTSTVSESVSIFVNPDGVVQFGGDGSTIYASAPLTSRSVRVERDTAALVDPDCSGTIVLTGTFETRGDGAEFNGSWSSSNSSCFGSAGTVSGPVTARRVDPNARASRVFETSSGALRRAFREAE